jgi:hypothetical protein
MVLVLSKLTCPKVGDAIPQGAVKFLVGGRQKTDR